MLADDTSLRGHILLGFFMLVMISTKLKLRFKFYLPVIAAKYCDHRLIFDWFIFYFFLLQD